LGDAKGGGKKPAGKMWSLAATMQNELVVICIIKTDGYARLHRNDDNTVVGQR